MRLPRKFSMTEKGEFTRVRENGEARPGRYVVVSTLVDSRLEHFKLGLIATKKMGKAHERNAFRRKIRAIVQKHGEHLRSDAYIVTIARWRAPEASFIELEKEWLRLANKLGILTSDDK